MPEENLAPSRTMSWLNDPLLPMLMPLALVQSEPAPVMMTWLPVLLALDPISAVTVPPAPELYTLPPFEIIRRLFTPLLPMNRLPVLVQMDPMPLTSTLLL